MSTDGTPPPRPPVDSLHPVFSSTFHREGPESEDLQAVNAALNEAANSGDPSTVPHVIDKHHRPPGAAHPPAKLLPDSLKDGVESGNFFGARSPA